MVIFRRTIIRVKTSYYMKRKTFRIIARGGHGDLLLSTPVFGAIKQTYPDCRIIVFDLEKNAKVKNGPRDIFKHNPNIDEMRSTSFIANPVHYAKYFLKLIKFHWLSYDNYEPGFTYEKRAPHIIADMFGVKLDSSKLEVYLTREEEEWGRNTVGAYRNPIVIHITSLFSQNQTWPLRNWEKLIGSLPEYTFIQLGLANEERVEGAVDLRGKTSFRQGLSILKSASSFVGVISSFAHATNAFGIPGVVLFGASTPLVWGHPNNINLYKHQRCSPCIDMLKGSPCPYESPCMTTIAVEEVREALLSQLAKRTSKGMVNQLH
jgi:ADP-heptose:LPS heptosyltransferase